MLVVVLYGSRPNISESFYLKPQYSSKNLVSWVNHWYNFSFTPSNHRFSYSTNSTLLLVSKFIFLTVSALSRWISNNVHLEMRLHKYDRTYWSTSTFNLSAFQRHNVPSAQKTVRRYGVLRGK